MAIDPIDRIVPVIDPQTGRATERLVSFARQVESAIGTPANGPNSIAWTSGTGSPEGVVTAAPGSLYTNSSGGVSTTLYVKESGTGNTGWVAK